MSEGNDERSADLKYPAPDRDISFEILEADARDIPADDNTADLVVTSPPYWQKRDYGFDDQIGQEPTPEEFVDTILDCMDEWQRVLRPTGSIFLNIGDTYEKRSLTGVPEMLVQVAQEDGWLLRNKILWAKDGGMPEPAKNRLANRHEYVFHFTQDNDYYYDLFGYSKAFGNEGWIVREQGYVVSTLKEGPCKIKGVKSPVDGNRNLQGVIHSSSTVFNIVRSRSRWV
jgi:hypothetical protein